MSTVITRHFVTLGGRWGPRQVHYRRAGRGPAVLLLHQSPQSSREMTDLMGQWARHFTLVAPDTPGYGRSDPLGPAEISIREFAQALAEFTDAIGLRRFGVYGFHTGASIGLWLAAAHPGRVTALAANGLTQQDEAERQSLLANYLPPVEPRWDGSHLAWLWARVREQTLFFPWYEPSAAGRMAFDMPTPDQLQFALTEFLRAGDHYAAGYRAAFDSHPETVLPGLQVPLLVTAARQDPLHRHLERLADLPANAATESAGDRADARARCLEHLLSHRGDDAPAAVATRPVPGRLWNTMVPTDNGQLRVQVNLEGSGEPLLFMHAAGESSETAHRMFTGPTAPGRGRPIVIPDLPGHGESDPALAAQGPRIADCADAGLRILNALGINQAVVSGQGAGAWSALEVMRRGTFGRRRPMLLDVPWLTGEPRRKFLEHGIPAIAPLWHGGHLLMAWHLLRDGRLFFPWFERRAEAARHVAHNALAQQLDPRRLHLELLDLLRSEGAWQNLWRSALDYDALDALGNLQEGVLAATPWSAWRAATMAASGMNPGLIPVTLPDDPAEWLPAMLDSWK